MASAKRASSRPVTFVELFDDGGEVPLGIKLCILMDVLEPLATAKRPLSLRRREKGSRHALKNLQLGVRGKAKLAGRGNKSGVADLVWEVLAGAELTKRAAPPLDAFADDIDADVEAVLVSALSGDLSKSDVRAFHRDLVIASAGKLASHREVARLVSATKKQRAESAAGGKNKKKADGPTVAKRAEPTPVVIDSFEQAVDELDAVLAEALAEAAPDGWDSWQLAPSSTAPPESMRRATPTASSIPRAPRAPSLFEATSSGVGAAPPVDMLADDLIEDAEVGTGEIEIVDRPKKGAGHKPPPVPSRPSDMPRPDILLVAKDKATAAHLAGTLRREGLSVDVVNEVKNGLVRGAMLQPRAVICDGEGLVESGAKFARELRDQSPRACMSPVVFLVGPRAKLATGRRLGRDIVLTKPYAISALVSELTKLLGAAEPRGQSERPPSIAPPPGETVMGGDLSHFSMSTLLSMLQLERESGQLLVESRNRKAKLQVQQGKVTGGVLGGKRLRAKDVIAAVSHWDEGKFAFQAFLNASSESWVQGARVSQRVQVP